MLMRRQKPIDPRKAELRRYYREEAGIAKPEAQATTDRRDEKHESERDARVRSYVFARERNIDRVTRRLPAESRHELHPKGAGGKVTRENCVAVQGDGTRGIHGLLQRHEITYRFEHPMLGAEGTIYFKATTLAAAEAMHINVGEEIVSPLMVETEIDGL